MPRASADLDDLIAGIYDAALSPDSWQGCYDGMRTLIGADSMLATLQDTGNGQASLLASNLDIRFLEEYAQGWWAKDVWALGVIGRPRGQAYIISDFVPDSELLNSEIYNDLVRKYVDCRHCLGAIVDVGEGRGVMGLHRPSGAPDFTSADRRLFQRLVPHIRQSLRLGRRFADSENGRASAMLALDALAFGIVVVDAACRPLLMNDAAKACFAPGRGMLGGSARQPIRAASSPQTHALHRLVHLATRPIQPAPGAMLIERSASATPLMLLVSPLIGRLATLFGIARPAALIVIRGNDETAPAAQGLRQMFGLTAAETQLATILAQGGRLEDIAETRAVGIATLRSQLGAILRKTGTDRQAALVRLLTQLSVHKQPEG